MSWTAGGFEIRVVIVQRRFHPNTLGWVKGMRAIGHDVRLVLHATGRPGDPHTDAPIVAAPPSPALTAILQVVLRTGRRRDAWVPRLGVLWREVRHADLVLLKQVRATSVIVSVVALLCGTRRVAWSNDGERLEHGHWRWLRRLGVIPRRQIVTATNRTAALGSATADTVDHATRFIPYAVDPVPAGTNGRAPDPDTPGLRLLTVGKYGAPRKRVWWTIEAARRAGILDGDTRFTFAGAGDADDDGAVRIRRIATETGTADRVTLHFDVPFEQMGDVYAGHDVLVVPSRDEPFGMVVLEAMAHGLAVVTSDSVGARSCVIPGETGLVFDSENLDELGEHLRRLAADRDLTRRMGAHGRRLATAHASPEGCARAIIEFAAARAPRRARSRVRGR